MELEQLLQHLGLTDKETKVYLATLQLGTASVPRISELAGTKRPTTYLILEDLRKKHLVTRLLRGAVTIYSAESPERLLEEASQKEELIKKNLPSLLAIYNTKKEKPKITYYQGEDSIIKLYEEIFKEKEILFYGSIGSIPPAIFKHIERYLTDLKSNAYYIREILQADAKSIEYAKINRTETHQIKIADKKYLLPTDNIIYGDKVAIITYKGTPMAVVIKSGDVVATQKSIFEMVWNVTK